MEYLELDHDHAEKHRYDLFGYEIGNLTHAYTVEMLKHELPGGNEEWRRMSYRERGKRLAAIQLRNMVATLKRDQEQMKRNREDAAREARKGKKSLQ